MKRKLFGRNFNEINLECSDKFPVTIDHPIGSETIEEGKNSTFYCYNTTGGTKEDLEKHNSVSLDVTSHPALYPGKYNIIAEMFYLNDTYAPELSFVDESYFDQYFTDGQDISFEVEIIDPHLEAYQGSIIRENEQDIPFIESPVVNKTDIYEFVHQSISISEGNYSLEVSAEDFNGNMNKMETEIKIDNTEPNITLIEPTEDEVYSEILPIGFNVTDKKSGVDNESAEVRLREIVNGTICPTTGGSIGNYSCTTTEWIKLHNVTKTLFKEEINTTELNLNSGEYWLDARAEDLLGNNAEWIADEDE